MLEKETLQKIRESLPHGAQSEIAKRAGVSKFTVSNVLKGNTIPKLAVLEAILEVAKQYQQVTNALKGISGLTDNLNGLTSETTKAIRSITEPLKNLNLNK